MVEPMEPAEWRERVGRQLEVSRKARGIPSMRAAAKIAGFSEATWRQLESGERRLSPDQVVAPSPRITTLTAAARAVGLDPVQIAADADIYTDDDIRYAEDEEYAYARLGDHHDSIAQTMTRNAEGIVGFRTGAQISDRAAALEARLQMVLHDLSIGDRQQVLQYAEALLYSEDHRSQVVREYEGLGPRPALRVAADEGSPDPHDDKVGAATTRHPGGADPDPDAAG